MSRALIVDELYTELRETVAWSRSHGWLVIDAWESDTWGDIADAVDHCVIVTNGRDAVVMMLAVGLGDTVVVTGGIKVREGGRIVLRRRLANLGDIAAALLAHGTIDLRAAS